ncbi:hypothetical protein [Natronomonas sp. EA1]|uniref:hypothetical protein n=1 Tax=Natronomonas sp. EA1 TaxID=3421655 RepID=UPI003EBDF035
MPSQDNPQSSLQVQLPAYLLQSIVEPPVDIAPEGIANFRWTEDALIVKTVDVANAIVINQTISQSCFSEFHVTPPENQIVVGTRCKTLLNLLNAAESDESVNLELRKNNRISVSFSDVNYQLSSVDPSTVQEPNIPDLDYDAEVIMHSGVLQRAHQVIGMMSDSIKLELGPHSFKFSGHGDSDIAEIDVEVVPTEGQILEDENTRACSLKNVSSDYESKYGSGLIRHANKFASSDCISLFLGEDYPLKIATEREDGKIPTEIIIAPRMDSQ